MKKLSKALILCLVSITCLVSCTNIKLQQLKWAYSKGNDARAEVLWRELWNNRGEMSCNQSKKFAVITKNYDSERYYAMKNTLEESIKKKENIRQNLVLCEIVYNIEQKSAQEKQNQVNLSQNTNQGSGYSNSQKSQIYYWECSWCGMILQSDREPDKTRGRCTHPQTGTRVNHNWYKLCTVGTKYIIRCKTCGLQLQTDQDPYRHIDGGGRCRSSFGSGHRWEVVY